MEPKADHNEIMYMLGSISSDIKGINAHLEKLNGKTEKTANRVDDLERGEIARQAKASVWGILGGAIISGAIWLLNHTFK